MCPPDTLEFFTVALMKCPPTPFWGGRISLDNVLSIYTTIFFAGALQDYKTSGSLGNNLAHCGALFKPTTTVDV